LVDDAIGLLVKHFGAEQVRASLAKASASPVRSSGGQPRSGSNRRDLHANTTVTSMLEQLRQGDEEKYRLLAGFYTQLKERTVLP
jgi:hypothetical protein